MCVNGTFSIANNLNKTLKFVPRVKFKLEMIKQLSKYRIVLGYFIFGSIFDVSRMKIFLSPH